MWRGRGKKAKGMKHWIMLVATIAVALQAAAQEPSPAVGREQKEKLRSLLGDLKTKAAEARKVGLEVSLPVASAGARGVEFRSASPFAPLWPQGAYISPLTALSVNLEAAAAGHANLAAMQRQLAEFLDAFNEFRNEQLLRDLKSLLTP